MNDPDSTMEVQPISKTRSFRQLGTILSALMCAVVSASYLAQPDWLTAMVLIQPWCWLIPGLMLAICGFCRELKSRSVIVLTLWAGFTCLFVEETYSLCRVPEFSARQWQAVRESGRGIRVVSLNCNVGQTRCVEEVADWKPDIVLLQESPGSEQLKALSEMLFGAEGAFLHGGDVSILVRGRLRPQLVNPNPHIVCAEVELSSGIVANVVSTHLSPPVSRLDFWLPGFWIDHRDKRIEHRAQIQQIMQQVNASAASTHLIVGGDFNAPPNDDALAALRPRLIETFQYAGHGWGATGTNGYPLFRVDQVWAGPTLRASAVVAQKTQHSDHRMVVCDLVVAD